ncbi:hypothetical protein [Pseudarthrobacter sp. NCCP-2145]|uniref:hypothetical protein n=1 Tax=Pseudarthrobacter sp. NCCP-2145 TaxID=2942290 RepID=UPI00203C2015|nr:hypothetical protein [Pseudarthrobacter sp. NCCP-2145]
MSEAAVRIKVLEHGGNDFHLNSAETAAISSGLPATVELTTGPIFQEDQLIAAAGEMVEISIWLRDLWPLVMAGAAGAAGKSAWEAAKSAVTRLLARRKAKVGDNSIDIRWSMDIARCPVELKLSMGREFREQLAADYFSQALDRFELALPEIMEMVPDIDPEHHRLEIAIKKDHVTARLLKNDLYVARKTVPPRSTRRRRWL